MLSPKSILDNINAIGDLKQIRFTISFFKFIVITGSITGAVIIYYSTLKPILENSKKTPIIEQQVIELTKKIEQPAPATIDTSLHNKVDDINKNIDRINISNREIKEKLLIIEQEFPQFQQRFDDIEKGFEIQFQSLKKNKSQNLVQNIKYQ